jgi:hypothetical protein
VRTSAPDAQPLNELEIIQNSALGAYAIWQFALAFQEENGRAAVLPLAFLVLPLLLHRPTLQVIGSTRKASGLALFAAKLGEQRENLLAVHERALTLRKLTLQSIAMGVRARLLTVNYSEATVRANAPEPSTRNPALPERIRGFTGAAQKVGYWFSKVDLYQVASTLKVEF